MATRYRDDTQTRLARVMGIPMGDGRIFRPSADGRGGTITSAGDAASAEATRARDAMFDARVRGQAIGSRPVGPADPEREAMAQQLLASQAFVPERNYTPAAMSRATTGQIAGELEALKQRPAMLEAFLKGERGRRETAEFDTTQAETASLTGRADQMLTLGNQLDQGIGAGVLRSDMQAQVREFADSPLAEFRRGGGRITPELASKAALSRRETGGGFATADEAQRALGTRKGQITQNAAGRWLVQITEPGPEAATTPNSPLAKLQSDLRAAEAEGRTADAEALRRSIEQETSNEKPFSVREFQMQPDLMKQYGMSYGKYLADYNRLKAEGASPTPTPTPAAGNLPRPASRQERDKLPPGTRYIGPDGKTYTKK